MFISTRAIPARQHGLSMVELILFIVVVSVALTGVLTVFNLTVRNSANPVLNKQLQAIAEGFMEEVSSMPFTFCDPNDPQASNATSASLGPSGSGCSLAVYVESTGVSPDGETRTSATNPFNNVDDFNYNATTNAYTGYTENPVTDISGTHTYAPYQVLIHIVPEALNGIGSTALTSPSVRIVVTVTATASGAAFTLEGYRTQYAPTALP